MDRIHCDMVIIPFLSYCNRNDVTYQPSRSANYPLVPTNKSAIFVWYMVHFGVSHVVICLDAYGPKEYYITGLSSMPVLFYKSVTESSKCTKPKPIGFGQLVQYIDSSHSIMYTACYILFCTVNLIIFIDATFNLIIDMNNTVN